MWHWSIGKTRLKLFSGAPQQNAHKGMIPHLTPRVRGVCQKCCISLCSKMFIDHFYQIKQAHVLKYYNIMK